MGGSRWGKGCQVKKEKNSVESEDISKAMKLGEKESFIFQDGTKMYRCASEPEGYQCPMCPKVFSQLGRHINSSECGKSIDTKRFTAELKKYLKTKKLYNLNKSIIIFCEKPVTTDLKSTLEIKNKLKEYKKAEVELEKLAKANMQKIFSCYLKY